MLREAGLGCTMMPLSNLDMDCLSKELINQGSTLQNTFKQISCSIAITLMTLSLTSRSDINYYRLSEQITDFNGSTMKLFAEIQSKLTQNGVPLVLAQSQ